MSIISRPPFALFAHISFLLIFSCLFFQRKLNHSLFNVSRKISGTGIVKNKCVKLFSIKGLNIVSSSF